LQHTAPLRSEEEEEKKRGTGRRRTPRAPAGRRTLFRHRNGPTRPAARLSLRAPRSRSRKRKILPLFSRV